MSSSSCESLEDAACNLYDSGVCRSCSLLSIAKGSRRREKLERLHTLFRAHSLKPKSVEDLLSPYTPWGSRTKVKLAVTGTITEPIIGIVDRNFVGTRLVECPLPPNPVRELLHTLEATIRSAEVPPYDIAGRRGELKYLLIVLNSTHTEAIVRFVLRSTQAVPRLRKQVAQLKERHPWIKVVTCNIQPKPAAIIEGEAEIFLTDEQRIRDVFSGVPLFFGPQSFIQVTHEIAEKLYLRFATLVASIRPHSVLDLYCGVGGFGLSVATLVDRVSGIEISADAIESARRSAREMGLDNTTFVSASVDHSLNIVKEGAHDLIVVNPPRRGLQSELCSALLAAQPAHIVYSSCNPETLCRDVTSLLANYTIEFAAPFDMFPLTDHTEVLLHLARR